MGKYFKKIVGEKCYLQRYDVIYMEILKEDVFNSSKYL